MKKTCFLFFILLTTQLFSQEKDAENLQLNIYNDSLKVTIKKLYSAETDIERRKHNLQLNNIFNDALSLPNSFSYPFDSLNDIARLMSPDETFRIINWNVPNDDGTQSYYGFIQKKQINIIKRGAFKKKSKETFLLFPLTDRSATVKKGETYISDNKKWFGMLYYKVIPKKAKNKTYYTLLAWDGNDQLSTKKIIDVLTFTRNGTPRFGAYLFNMNKMHQKRVIFEYSNDCSMSLRYDTKKDSIIFDHLIPSQPLLEGQYQYYCPDLGCDGFGFKRGRWNFGADVNATNEKNDRDKYYVDPRDKHTNKESDTFVKDAKPKKKKK